MSSIILKIKSISPNAWNPNKMDEKDFLGLKRALIKQSGNISNPILVRKLGKRYEIIDGEHRYNAMKEAGFEDIVAVIVEADDKEARIKTVTMNKFRGTIDEVKMATLIGDLQSIYGMSEEQIEEELGMTDEDMEDANELNEMESVDLEGDIGEPEEARDTVVKLNLSESERKVVYDLSEATGYDIKTLIMMSVAEATRYLNDGNDIMQTVSSSSVEEYEEDDFNF